MRDDHDRRDQEISSILNGFAINLSKPSLVNISIIRFRDLVFGIRSILLFYISSTT
jgi:hypothetical protein